MPRLPLQHLPLVVLGLLLIAVVAGCTGADSSAKVQPTESDYNLDQLKAWRSELVKALWQIGIPTGSGLNERTKLIMIETRALRGVPEAFESVISTLDIPRDAIVFEVGCENFKQWPPEPQIPLDESFHRSIEVSMEIPTQATYGETVPLKLTLRNVGDKPVAFLLGGNPYHDFVITTPDGEGVWYWRCTRYSYDVLGGGNLEPGEEIEFAEEWQQVNIRGEPVPPGIYLVRGVLETGAIDAPTSESHVTKPHRLEVLKR